MAEFPRAFGNKYTLLGRLGRGGMGEVLAARVEGFRGIQKMCVIKTLKAELAADREYVTRFLDEARLVMQLTHRNVCTVFDVGQIDGTYYLAMDLIRGRDLKTFWLAALESGRPLDRALAMHICIEMLEGLDYAHRATDVNGDPLGVVHRDVSPHNVMISFEGEVKLIDFGLAFHTKKLEKTESSIVHGKVAYMPPEQIKGEGADVRADVFACAVVLYELLTGDRYYSAVPPHLLVAQAASGTHEPEKWNTLDVDLRATLRLALSPDKERRTASASRFADELRAYVSRRGLRADGSTVRVRMKELFNEEVNPWERVEATRVEQSRSIVSANASKSAKAPGSVRFKLDDKDAPPTVNENMSAVRARPASAVIMLPPEVFDPPNLPESPRRSSTASHEGDSSKTRDRPRTKSRILDHGLSVDKGAGQEIWALSELPDRRTAVENAPPTMILHGCDIEALSKKRGRAPPPLPPHTPEPIQSESKKNDEGKPRVRVPRDAPNPAHGALAGLGLVLMFVAFIFIAPWQKHDVREKKPLADGAGVPEKIEFLKEWCPVSRCMRNLSGKESSPSYADDVDTCYRRCLEDK